MSSNVPIALFPVMLVQDRYQGVYSGGAWLAIACADSMIEGLPRAAWVLENGPASDDVTAGLFWAHAPAWIVSGATPDQAIDALLSHADRIGDAWSPPPIESDPRYWSFMDHS